MCMDESVEWMTLLYMIAVYDCIYVYVRFSSLKLV
jgi:hypothetical protein